MAWTTPKTWSVGEVVTAANMNTHLRDNLNTLVHLMVRKTTTETVTSNTTLQADDVLTTASLGANTSWYLKWTLIVSAASTGGGNIKVGFSHPAGATLFLAARETPVGDTHLTRMPFLTSADTNSWIVTNGGSPAVIEGVVRISGTAGAVGLQWAQNTSNANATQVEVDSTLWGVQLA